MGMAVAASLAAQTAIAQPFPFTSPSPNFDTDQPGDGPPDANGAVGPNHYIAIVNFTFEIFDKNGVKLSGPTDPQTLWSGAPANDDCRVRGRGDPYVLYDHLADRWIIAQLANHNTNVGNPLQVQCIAVSRGPNPVTDGYFAYTYQLGVKNDYPKLAVWPDGYYMITQRFAYDSTNNALDAWVFDRTNMLAGNAGTFQTRNTPFNGHHDVIALPSELTGPVPPAGSPNFYVRPYDGNLYADGAPRIEIFEFHTDFAVPANTTFVLSQTLTPATFRSDICNGAGLNQNCVPQPGTGVLLDALSIWPMSPAQYRNFGDHETLLFSHAVNADGAGLVGIRWYELRRSPVGAGAWTIFQQGTYAPNDPASAIASIHRWTSSIAMDSAGNIALGYNASNDGIAPHPTVFPSMRVVGRLATDPLGVLTTPEVPLATGGGSNGGNRWGDYSAMRVDPSDDCTFWYTTQYVAAAGQRTHVGAVRFAACSHQFAAFNAVFTEYPNWPGFSINSNFTLAPGGDINPPTEQVKLQIGTFSTTIPPGSFVSPMPGYFSFVGVINGINLKLVIRQTSGNHYIFGAIATGVNLTTINPPGPSGIILIIGDDSGVATVLPIINDATP
jgi:hypothetical protein